MLDATAALWSVAAVGALALSGWAASVAKRDASIVDCLWSLFFLLALGVYVAQTGAGGARTWLVLTLVALWALRLSGYLAWRNWGAPEDRRYGALRLRHEPGFAWKSLYLVFGLQALLAAALSAPLLAAASASSPLNALDLAGVALWLAGFAIETIADLQLARFKADPANRGRVLDRGIWRYSRHPNYFGEAVLWWGYYLIAAAAGASWTVFAPLAMTYLLLRVSGVALLERDIHERRPGYLEYVARTSAFVPWPPRRTK